DGEPRMLGSLLYVSMGAAGTGRTAGANSQRASAAAAAPPTHARAETREPPPATAPARYRLPHRRTQSNQTLPSTSAPARHHQNDPLPCAGQHHAPDVPVRSTFSALPGHHSSGASDRVGTFPLLHDPPRLPADRTTSEHSRASLHRPLASSESVPHDECAPPRAISSRSPRYARTVWSSRPSSPAHRRGHPLPSGCARPHR